jgi:hypothetical protein
MAAPAATQAAFLVLRALISAAVWVVAGGGLGGAVGLDTATDSSLIWAAWVVIEASSRSAKDGRLQ